MSYLIGVLFWGGFAICLICAAMVNRCHAVMLDQVNRRLPEGQKMKRPFFSYKWHAIVSLHEQFYPGSCVRAEQKFLLRLSAIAFGSIGFIMLAWVIYRGPVHR